MEIRKIVHIDMDAFFASVEQRDFPEYQGRPVIVGGAPNKRGVVAACSYEARKYGIHSAMPSSRAYRLCPNAIFLRPRFDVYRRVSKEIFTIFRSFTDKVESLSLDEAYLDVSSCHQYDGSATNIARVIKQKIKNQCSLTASAGVSYNKFLAKIASDMDKPDGLYVITPDQGEAFVARLPIGKFFGVGKATKAKMKILDIHNGADLKGWTREELKSQFGKMGDYFYNIARGIDHRIVVSKRVRKSLGTETTFEHDLSDRPEMLDQLTELAKKVAYQLQKKELYAKTITMKVKYDNFQLVTRSVTLGEYFNDIQTLLQWLPQLLDKTDIEKHKVRLLGVSTSNFAQDVKVSSNEQIDLL